MDDNPGAGLQRRHQALQDFDTVLVRPVMKNGPEEVYIRLNWLRIEEVTRRQVKRMTEGT
jgi:hypothetical protein